MTLVLPRLSELTRDEEYTLTTEQELRLLDDRERRSRWWVAPVGTLAPGPGTSPHESGHPYLNQPWRHPWLQLNSITDPMAGVCILDQDDASRGLLIWVHPTEECEIAWQSAWDAHEPRSLGCETGIKVDPDYRAVFRYAEPLARLSESNVRWRFRRPTPDAASWDIMTAGWRPRPARDRQDDATGEIEA
jgi:hypothetical protein